MKLISIPVRKDNYVWILSDNDGHCLIIDPGEAEPVLQIISQYRWSPVAILLTHHHNDHTNGVLEILLFYPKLMVFGPSETQDKGVNTLVEEGDQFYLLGLKFIVISTPGHTLGHVVYYTDPYLFCGDTLFSAGCGRIFEGTPQQMFQSLQKINRLPGSTLICSAHEYTLSNLMFSCFFYPTDPLIKKYYSKVKILREKQLITLPTRLQSERKINIFLRTQDVNIHRLLNMDVVNFIEWEVFSALRKKKDSFIY
ncbi:Hydroxyacylglutathione hydrolase GloB [Candidatus Erwinia haradaeae]|uniref:Hydroxyacylglutathione hydrolase n=1 Tax=Candidatus Erwinia haradaeae TaxID=1922217 RepID=A0A451CZK7_9GAMM|nr:hydroxyacylglutathione hydrolase [Candidatus Erwinia haradaeae]VFP78838.1 Hydroxyacylglutathione hydrolase GloB [Candidatus Erwinia haradaeae]